MVYTVRINVFKVSLLPSSPIVANQKGSILSRLFLNLHPLENIPLDHVLPVLNGGLTSLSPIY